MESMADGHPIFLFDFINAHQSDLRQKQRSRNCVCMRQCSYSNFEPPSSTHHDHERNRLDGLIDQTFLSNKEEAKSAF